MIHSITVINPLNESLELVLSNPESSGLIISSIDGLGPAKASVHLSDLATDEGSTDNGAKLETRNIVISLRFLAKPTIEEIRLKTYRFFPIKQLVKIIIKTDNRECYTIGRVESNVPNIFSKEEGCQISILCPDPYFYDIKETNLDNLSFDDTRRYGFMIPIYNNSIIINDGEYINQGRKMTLLNNTNAPEKLEFEYNGDIETNCIVKVAFNITPPYNGRVSIILNDKEIIISSTLGSGANPRVMTAPGEITIDTNKNNKKITYNDINGYIPNMLKFTEMPINWLTIKPGKNTLSSYYIYSNGNRGNSMATIYITYNKIYEGV